MITTEFWDKVKQYIDTRINNVADKLKGIYDDYNVKDIVDNLTNIKGVYDIKDQVKNVDDIKDEVKDVSEIKDQVKKVGDNVSSVVNVSDIKDQVVKVSDHKDEVVKVSDNINDCKTSMKKINALLNVDLGSGYVDDDGHLILKQINTDSEPSIDDKGHLVITYD